MRITITLDMPNLSQKLDTARLQRGWSFQKLGRIAKVSASAVWALLNRQSKVAKLSTAWMLAQALDVDLRAELVNALNEQTEIFTKKGND